MEKEKVVLAYSGGLDTTAIIPWLKDRKVSLRDLMKGQNYQEQASSTLLI